MSKFPVTDEQLLDLALKVIVADENEINGLAGEICAAHILSNSEHSLSDEEVEELLNELIIQANLKAMVESGELNVEFDGGEIRYYDNHEEEYE